MSDSPSYPTVLADGDLVVREPQPGDREAAVSLADDERLFTYMMIRFSRDDMDGWFTAWQEEISSAERSYWPLVIDLDGTTTGFTMLSRSSPQVAELQWYVSPSQWGQGCATKATRLVGPCIGVDSSSVMVAASAARGVTNVPGTLTYLLTHAIVR